MRTQTGDLLNALCGASGCEVDEVFSTDSENEVAFVCGVDPDYEGSLGFCVLYWCFMSVKAGNSSSSVNPPAK